MSGPPPPVVILTGFLGAGKTTLLRRVLAEPHGQSVGLIVNELGIGGTEVEASASERVELFEGCVCCTRNPDLIAALGQLTGRGDLTHLVIETTGLADPLALTFTLERPDVAALARLDAVVTVVDCANAAATRGADEWQAQVRAADLLVLSKTDLVDASVVGEVRGAVQSLNRAARIVEAPALDARLLLDTDDGVDDGGDDGGVDDVVEPTRPNVPRAAPAAARHSGFRALSLQAPPGESFDADRLEDLLEALPQAVFRAKGLVRDAAGRWLAFHVVAGRLALEPDVPAPAHGESRLVFLGRGLDEAALTAAVEACKAVAPPGAQAGERRPT
jgi:G3E family GTPase